MQTSLAKQYRDSLAGQDANRILRNCVHCGFCTATCPTYQLLGDELDSPRGRIYLIKQALEGQQVTKKTMQHLDRCLTCRSCETTCPSGVEYAHLLDIGRNIVEQQIQRPLFQRLQRFMLRKILLNRKLFRTFTRLIAMAGPLIPRHMRLHHVANTTDNFVPTGQHQRSVLLLDGCVQPVLSPGINNATRKILDRIGIKVIEENRIKCCGAISHHLNAHNEAIAIIKNNIDAWWPYIEKGVEAIISNASGCGVTLKDYATYLKHDREYATKADTISSLVKDISEIIQPDDVAKLRLKKPRKISFHAPCTLQHGLQLKDSTETLLGQLGLELNQINDAHLCCGSAGTYSILQPEISRQLKQNKLDNLCRENPDLILTANIGCLHHLQSGTTIPVKHWTELVADHL